MSQIQVPPLANLGSQEPSMYLERPSSARSQDIRHILSKTFRDLLSRDTVDAETIKNLNVSKHNEDPYHEHYVNSLQQILQERERRLAECAMLERHIMQAQAKAMSSDEKELNKVSSSCDQYFQLGIPTGQSTLHSCLDTELLKKHGLIVPEDYSTAIPVPAQPPQGTPEPSYLKQTVSSDHRLTSQTDLGDSPLPTTQPDDNLEETVSLHSMAGDSSEEQMNKLWQSHMRTEQREVDKTDMNHLDAKVNYMKNPRHIPPSALPITRSLIKQQQKQPKEVGRKPKPEKKTPKEPSVVFLASPPVVVFPKYAVGQVYEMTLELKNVTSVLRPCRVLPPSTPYFSVGLGQFPGEQGLVAPGMSCHYKVRFNPDSLGDFDDFLTVQTQSSSPMIIQLQGRRQPPVLSLPPEWDVGYCLVGGLHIVHFLVSNQGGPGRFCLMPTSAWPATSFKSSVKNGSVSLPPFEIRPSVFELLAGEKTIIEVAFRPSQVREYCEEITLTCDNCQVKHFKIKGESQLARVKITHTEGGASAAVPGEICDISAQNLVKFEDLNPFTFTDKTIDVKNLTNVDMRFSWNILKPILKAPDVPGGDNSLMIPQPLTPDRVQDIDSVFSIHPPTGTLPADSITEFKITFAPPMTGYFNSVLHMLLQQVPATPPDMLSLSEAASLSSIELDRREKTSDANLLVPLPSFQDTTALEVEVKGQCVPLNVVLHPYAMIVPGSFLVGITIKKQIVLVNHSYSGITFQWQSYSDDHILEVEPPFGELGPGMALDLELSVTGSKPGKIDKTLFCYVDSLDKPLHLHVEADIKGPDVSIEEPDVNFGLVQLGQSETREITLTNMCQVTTRWSIKEFPLTDNNDEESQSEFTFKPSVGSLKPLERKKISITFTPSKIQSVNTVFGVNVEDGGQSCNICACGEVQMPRACLLTCKLQLNEIYLDVPVDTEFTLMNQTLLPTHYKWGQAVGDDIEHVELEIQPSEGILQAREQLRLSLHFTSHKQGMLSPLHVPCEVEGMEKPLWLEVNPFVKGLCVNYKVSLDGPGSSVFKDVLMLNYGETTYLGEMPKQYLHIVNESGITTPYSINVECFSSHLPAPPNPAITSKTDDTGIKTSKGRVSLKRTPNISDPFSRTSSKAYQEVCQTMLREGKGAAFVVYPAQGSIPPFAEEVIEVTGFSDMWGSYSDNLIVKVGDLEPVYVPVKMNVVGCPLNFQLTAGQPNQQPIIRFGSHIAGTAPISRKMQINNTSPFDLRLDWEVFTQSKSDKKLVDFVVRYGELFPQRDSEGIEVVPTLPDPPSMKRQATDYIFNTPDTTPGVSRQGTQADGKALVIPPTINEATPRSSPEERQKVVSTFLRLHDGQQSTKPYDVFPKQLVIPAKSKGVVSVSFTPSPNVTMATGIDCPGYAHAYITLDNKGSNPEGLVSRKQGFDIDTLRVEMTAQVKPALLTIECDDEEGMRYRGAMSDLISGSQMTAETWNVCSALLTNHTETPMTFQLRVKSPFILVNLPSTCEEDGTTVCYVTEMCTLKPRHTLPLKVAFQIDIDLLKFLDALETGEEVEGIELEVNDGERKLQFLYDLLVEFNNSSIQRLPLHASLAVPSIILSRETLDFGTCLVGQRREMDITISNKTASSSYWTVSIETQTDTCVKDTFQVTPSSGQLEAHVTHVSNSKTLIKVFFTAKHSGFYQTVFLFQGKLGEEPKRLTVTGQGSYDGKHQAIVNI